MKINNTQWNRLIVILAAVLVYALLYHTPDLISFITNLRQDILSIAYLIMIFSVSYFGYILQKSAKRTKNNNVQAYNLRTRNKYGVNIDHNGKYSGNLGNLQKSEELIAENERYENSIYSLKTRVITTLTAILVVCWWLFLIFNVRTQTYMMNYKNTDGENIPYNSHAPLQESQIQRDKLYISALREQNSTDKINTNANSTISDTKIQSDASIAASAIQAEASIINAIIQLLAVMATISAIYVSIQQYLTQKQKIEEDQEQNRLDLEDKSRKERLLTEQNRLDLEDKSRQERMLTEGLHLKERRQTEELHQENYNKDILRDFNECPNVRNAKIILESIAIGSKYLPQLHLELYQDNISEGNPALKCNEISYNHDEKTLIFTNPQKVEVIASLQTLANAFMVDSESVALYVHEVNDPKTKKPLAHPETGEPLEIGDPLPHSISVLENKICYSFDAFCEKFTMVGKLLLTHNAKIKKKDDEKKRLAAENNDEEPSVTEEQFDDLSDVNIWWDALDLPYWSSLLVWGSDSEEFMENSETTYFPFFSTWDPDDKESKIDDLINSVNFIDDAERDNIIKILKGENTAMLKDETFNKIEPNIKKYMESKKIIDPLSNFEPKGIFFHANIINSKAKFSSSDYVRISMMNYIRAYYPEVLSIAFILSFHDHVEVKQDDLKLWLSKIGIDEIPGTPEQVPLTATPLQEQPPYIQDQTVESPQNETTINES
jgi:hypothetical protein